MVTTLIPIPLNYLCINSFKRINLNRIYFYEEIYGLIMKKIQKGWRFIMEKKKLIQLINVAAGREPADLVFKNGNIVDVYQGDILKGDVAIVNGTIAAIGESYEGDKMIDRSEERRVG